MGMDVCGGGMFLQLVLFLVLIVVGIWLAVRAYRRGGDGTESSMSPRSSPLRILEDRYARGEIDRNEFEKRRGTLAP